MTVIAARVNRWLAAAATVIATMLGVVLMIAVVINIINIVGRYIFNRPVEGAGEVEIFMMIGIAFFGALVAHIRGRHLRMDVLARRFPRRLSRAVAILEALTAIGICGLVTWVSFAYTDLIWHLGIRSENALIPMWIPHSMLTIAFGFMTLVGVVRLFVPPPPAPSEPPELAT